MANPTAFTQNNPQGTHFSDGVRVGPIYGTSYATNASVGGNFATPVPTETPGDLLSQSGVLLGPTYTYFITPYASSVASLYGNGAGLPVQPGAIPAAGAFFTLNSTGAVSLVAPQFGTTGVLVGAGATTVSIPPVTLTKLSGPLSVTVAQGIVFDVPRCVSVTTAGSETAVLVAYGYDAYGFPVVSQLTLGTTTNLYVFPKAMKILLGIYISAQPAAAIGIGISDVFGLPYRVDNASQITANWAGLPLAQTTGYIGPAATIYGNLGVKTALFTTGAAPNGSNFAPASPAPFAFGNIPPTTGSVSSSLTNDVRGLIAVPTASNFTYALSGGMSKANQLVVQMYLPGANAQTAAVYAPGTTLNANGTVPGTYPSGVVTALGTPVLIPTTSGGLQYIQGYRPTLPVDLYGSPQYFGNPGTVPFIVP